MVFAPLPARVLDGVLDQLGLDDRPACDAAGLATVYSAWCRRVPFDNLRKLVALHFSLPEIPGIDPADFFAAWQVTGAGATCWGSNNALQALLDGLGFEARLHAASMFDGEVNHGTTIVQIGDEQWVVDTAIHSDAPLPLVEGQPAEVVHAGYRTAVRPDPGGWLIDARTPDPTFDLPCRIHGSMEPEFTVAANEKSRGWSPFNDGVMAQINDEGGSWLLRHRSLCRIDPDGTRTRELTDAEVDEFLVDVTGHAPQLVAEVRAVLDHREAEAAGTD